MYLSKKLSIVLTVAALTLILFFGLDPKGFRLSNNASWIPGDNGIRFGRYGVAYVEHCGRGWNGSDGLSMEVALRPESIEDKRFKFILVLHGGEDSDQLLVGQWLSSIIVMNGDDYDGRRHIKKLGVKDALTTDQARLATITSGKEGTRIYLEGKVAAESRSLFLRAPTGGGGFRLVVGNSVYGRNFWTGDIFGLAVYETALSEAEVKFNAEEWSRKRHFGFARQNAPKALYLFDEKKGRRVHDQAGGADDLEIPQRFKILSLKMLEGDLGGITLNNYFTQDVFINLAGFIPLGFILNAVFAEFGKAVSKYRSLLIVAACFILSLSIEIAQAWMPSRSSQALDLLMNTTGAFLGAAAYRYLGRVKLMGTPILLCVTLFFRW